MTINKIIILGLMGIAACVSCNKNDFLGAKPSSNLVVPSTLTDFQELLDNYTIMGETPFLGILSSDEYYLSYSFWQTLTAEEQNAYIWAPNIYNGQGNVVDWNYPYQQVFYANVVIDGLNKISPTNENLSSFNNIKGWALFARAYAFYNIAQTFAPIYDSATAASDLGIPLKLNPDVNQVVGRSSVKETYDQILSDLNEAENLVPLSIPTINRNRPSKPAVLALMARIYLSMRVYNKAGLYADSTLQLYSQLMDYNTATPFTPQNAETIFQSRTSTSSTLFWIIRSSGDLVDSNLYALYADTNDLRLQRFYRKRYTDGISLRILTYDGTGACFTGLATDEVYLIRAECFARSANVTGAMADLNTLLQYRWVTGTFSKMTAVDEQDALDKILLERRRELVFRSTRFSDLRRLNKEGYKIALSRQLNGQQYTLPPNSALYVLPIPPDEISLSGIQQNTR